MIRFCEVPLVDEPSAVETTLPEMVISSATPFAKGPPLNISKMLPWKSWLPWSTRSVPSTFRPAGTITVMDLGGTRKGCEISKLFE